MANVRNSQNEIVVRPGRPADTEACGRICYEAFAGVARHHNFPPDFPSVNEASGLVGMFLSHPNVFSVVAEAGGDVVGSNFLDERSSIAGVGPITVDPKMQNSGIGRRLMKAVLDRAAERKAAGSGSCRRLITAALLHSTQAWASYRASPLPACKDPPSERYRPAIMCGRRSKRTSMRAVEFARSSTATIAPARHWTRSNWARRASWSMIEESPATRRMSAF